MLVGGKVNCKLWIEKLGSCLSYIEHHTLNSDEDRLYIPRKEGGRGSIFIEDCVELAIRGLEVYVHKSEERSIQVPRGSKIDGLEATSVLKRSKKEKRLEDWKFYMVSIWGRLKKKLSVLGLGSEWKFGNRLKQIGIAAGIAQVQKTVLLGTSRILRNVLEI